MIVDTNVLLRAWAGDDAVQSPRARAAMADAESIFISDTTLCEFVWMARQYYKKRRADIAAAIRLLVSDPRIVVNHGAVEAGLALLDVGGDFADGVIDFQGRRLGGETFVTFDRKAAAVLKAQGKQSQVLSAE